MDRLFAGRIAAAVDKDMEPNSKSTIVLVDVLPDPHTCKASTLAAKVCRDLEEGIGTLADLDKPRREDKRYPVKVEAQLPRDLGFCSGFAQPAH